MLWALERQLLNLGPEEAEKHGLKQESLATLTTGCRKLAHPIKYQLTLHVENEKIAVVGDGRRGKAFPFCL